MEAIRRSAVWLTVLTAASVEARAGPTQEHNALHKQNKLQELLAYR